MSDRDESCVKPQPRQRISWKDRKGGERKDSGQCNDSYPDEKRTDIESEHGNNGGNKPLLFQWFGCKDFGYKGRGECNAFYHGRCADHSGDRYEVHITCCIFFRFGRNQDRCNHFGKDLPCHAEQFQSGCSQCSMDGHRYEVHITQGNGKRIGRCEDRRKHQCGG